MNKSERLLNLMFILLNTKFGVPRSKIKSLIQDYRESTSDMAFERMFERDKQELKSMGFTINVREDGFGEAESVVYSIDKTKSFFDVSRFSSIERLLLQVARERMSRRYSDMKELQLKLESDWAANYFSSFDEEGENADLIVKDLVRCLSDTRKIQMQYFGYRDEKARKRVITPLKFYLNGGRKYLIGFCHDARDYRVFRIDRITEITEILDIDNTKYSDSKTVELENFLKSRDEFFTAYVTLRSGREIALDVPESISFNVRNDSDLLEIRSLDHNELIHFLAANLLNISNIEPQDIKQSLKQYFKDSYSHVRQ